MQRNQNQMMKKNSKQKWIIILLLAIIAVLLASIFLNVYGRNDNDSVTHVSSLKNTSGTSAQNNTDLSTEENSQKNDYPYSVSFLTASNGRGTYGTIQFNLSVANEGNSILLTYETPNFSETQSAYLVPINIPTKDLKVNEHSFVKNVKINTELKLDSINEPATKDFFYPFNGNDTKIYAYHMNNGNTALAFQPGLGLDQYQVIEFEPL